MPQSPRWLLEHGRDEEARAVVYRLHGSDAATRDEADAEFAEMQETIKAEMLVRSRSLSDLWATRGMLRRTFVAVGVQVFGQFSGINVLNYFGPSMYRALGLSAGQSLLVQGIYGAVGPITNFLCVPLPDTARFGLWADVVRMQFHHAVIGYRRTQEAAHVRSR